MGIAILIFGALSCWRSVTFGQIAETHEAGILREIQHSSLKEIAKLFFSCATSELSKNDVSIFLGLLESKQVVEASLEISVPLEVRDIAFVCIEEITGKWFLPLKDKKYPVKAIVAHVRDDGSVVRFQVPFLSEGDFEHVKISVKKWLQNSPIK